MPSTVADIFAATPSVLAGAVLTLRHRLLDLGGLPGPDEGDAALVAPYGRVISFAK